MNQCMIFYNHQSSPTVLPRLFLNCHNSTKLWHNTHYTYLPNIMTKTALRCTQHTRFIPSTFEHGHNLSTKTNDATESQHINTVNSLLNIQVTILCLPVFVHLYSLLGNYIEIWRQVGNSVCRGFRLRSVAPKLLVLCSY